MTWFEIITIIISLFALAVSLIAVAYASHASKKSNETAVRQNEIAIGQTEIQIRELIENSKRPVQEWYAKYVECAADNKDLKDAYKKNYWVAIETNLNAYDEACAKYKDGKIDQVRFQKTYQAEIRNLV